MHHLESLGVPHAQTAVHGARDERGGGGGVRGVVVVVVSGGAGTGGGACISRGGVGDINTATMIPSSSAITSPLTLTLSRREPTPGEHKRRHSLRLVSLGRHLGRPLSSPPVSTAHRAVRAPHHDREAGRLLVCGDIDGGEGERVGVVSVGGGRVREEVGEVVAGGVRGVRVVV
jgi:hypothetical protein